MIASFFSARVSTFDTWTTGDAGFKWIFLSLNLRFSSGFKLTLLFVLIELLVGYCAAWETMTLYSSEGTKLILLLVIELLIGECTCETITLCSSFGIKLTLLLVLIVLLIGELKDCETMIFLLGESESLRFSSWLISPCMRLISTWRFCIVLILSSSGLVELTRTCCWWTAVWALPYGPSFLIVTISVVGVKRDLEPYLVISCLAVVLCTLSLACLNSGDFYFLRFVLTFD